MWIPNHLNDSLKKSIYVDMTHKVNTTQEYMLLICFQWESNVFIMVFSRHLKVNWKFWQVQVVCSVAQLGYQSMRKIRAIKKKNKKRIVCFAIANETLSEVYAFWYQRSQWLCFQKRFALTYWSTDLENPPTKMNSLHLIFILYANVCTIFL